MPGTNATFDYVIVGGNNAGLTVATRLAEELSFSVAVTEAGGFYEIDSGNLSIVPASATLFTWLGSNNFQPLVGWTFDTTPQEGSANRTLHYARGKTLGGYSARDYMCDGCDRAYRSDLSVVAYCCCIRSNTAQYINPSLPLSVLLIFPP